MIDPLTEPLISLREAAELFPRRRRGRKPSVATIYRYVAPPGYRGVVLESVRAAGALATSRQAVARFIRQMTELDRRGPASAYEAHRTGVARRTDPDRIEADLDAAGL